MWTNRQFWLDSTWRAFRTFCQTWDGILMAYAAYLAFKVATALKDPTVDVELGELVGGWGLWGLFLFAAVVSALRSLFQSIDRERAVGAALPSVPVTSPADPVTVAPVVVNNGHAPPVEPSDIVQDGHGGSLR
jgi:hypothetical protein